MNDIPDECDIASGTSQDVNGNGFPDECESEGQGAQGGGGTGGGTTAGSSGTGTTGGTTAGSSGTSGRTPWPAPDPLHVGTPETWAAFHAWCAEQTWGPRSALSGFEQFRRYVEKQRELGLPLRRAGG